MREDQAIK